MNHCTPSLVIKQSFNLSFMFHKKRGDTVTFARAVNPHLYIKTPEASQGEFEGTQDYFSSNLSSFWLFKTGRFHLLKSVKLLQRIQLRRKHSCVELAMKSTRFAARSKYVKAYKETSCTISGQRGNQETLTEIVFGAVTHLPHSFVLAKVFPWLCFLAYKETKTCIR